MAAGLAPVPAVEHEHYLTTGGGVYAAVTGDRAGKTSRRVEEDGVKDSRQRSGQGSRGGGGYVDRVGRSPGDDRKCVTVAGEVICVAF